MQLGPPGPRNVLLVDDSVDFSTLLERSLRQARDGTSVTWFRDGESAVGHLMDCGSRFPIPDLVLLDCVMPGGPSGFDVLRAIRSVEHLVPLLVIMLSGSNDPDHVTEAREAGADGYIVKPPERGLPYVVLAKKLLAWRGEESWRLRGGAAAGLDLAAAVVPLSSAVIPTMSVVPPVVIPAAAVAVEPNMLMQAFHFLRDMVLETFDPLDLAINRACRKHHISPAHARGKGLDQVTVTNRHEVIIDLMMEGYGDGDIETHFHVSERTMERLRQEWRRRKGGGSLADRGKS